MKKKIFNYGEYASILNKRCRIEFKNGKLIFYFCCPVAVILPKSSECGNYVSNSFNNFIGGSETNIEEFPWTVLLKKDGGTFEDHICEGSLINKRYILTSAHCVVQINLLTNEKQLINITTARLGEWNKKTDTDCQYNICSDLPVDIDIEKIIPHPEYKSQLISGHHDIALLRLTKEINYTKYIQPICLPLEENLKNNRFNDDSLDIVGWGNRMTGISSNIKLKTKIDIMDYTKCARIFYKILGVNIINSQYCSDVKKNVDTCKSDYGSPLIGLNYENKFEPKHFLAGIVSYGPVFCGNNNGLPTVYTRVGAYIDWILKNLEQ